MLSSRYRINKFNLCFKGTYDYNDAANGDWSEGGVGSWDVVVPAGYDALQLAGGVEWFPLSGKDLRLHAFYSHNSAVARRHSLEMGITWRFNLFNRK